MSGIGLERLTVGLPGRTSSRRSRSIPTILSFFVITPLVAAAVDPLLLRPISRGERPDAVALPAGELRRLRAALPGDPVIAAVGIALGLIALILPGIYLLVRWFFVAQCVVIEDKRGFDALRAQRRAGARTPGGASSGSCSSQLIAAIPALPDRRCRSAAAADAADREVLVPGRATWRASVRARCPSWRLRDDAAVLRPAGAAARARWSAPSGPSAPCRARAARAAPRAAAARGRPPPKRSRRRCG